jgi:hypothetical protein
MGKNLSRALELLDKSEETIGDTATELSSFTYAVLSIAHSLAVIATIMSEAQDNYTRSIKVKDVGRP